MAGAVAFAVMMVGGAAFFGFVGYCFWRMERIWNGEE